AGERELQRVELPTRGELPEERRMVGDVRGDNLDADRAKLRLHELKTSRSLPQTGEGREAQRQTVSRADIAAVRAEPAPPALAGRRGPGGPVAVAAPVGGIPVSGFEEPRALDRTVARVDRPPESSGHPPAVEPVRDRLAHELVLQGRVPALAEAEGQMLEGVRPQGPHGRPR